MELAFSTKALRAVCESEERAVRELGVDLASILKRRLADLRAAGNATDLVVVVMDLARAGCFAHQASEPVVFEDEGTRVRIR